MPTITDLTNVATWLGLAVAVVVLGRLLMAAAQRLYEVRLDIQPFTGPEAAKPELSSMHELVREELHAFELEGGGSGMSFVFAPDQKIDFAENIKAVPAPVSTPLNVLAGLANALPSRTRTIRGVVLPEGKRGYGVVVTLLGPSERVQSTVAIWERDVIPGSVDALSTSERYTRLTLAAAAWIAYRLLAAADPGDRAALLTQDWLSYARFRIAARIQLCGDPGTARMGYAWALDADPRNRGALFNLGVLDLQEMRNGSAFERLDATVREIELLQAIRRPREDRLWYRARYNRAVVRWNGRRQCAAEICQELAGIIRAADEEIWDLGGDDALLTGDHAADQVRFLAQVRAAALAFYAEVVATPAAS